MYDPSHFVGEFQEFMGEKVCRT